MQLATPTSARPCTRFDAQVEELHRLARAVEAGSPAARAGLLQWLDGVQQSDDPRHVGLYVFGAALAQRLEGRTAIQANLYLQRYERTQIELFNLLGRALPFVGLATTVCNQAIARACRGAHSAVLIDVGIGTGRQVLHLLPALVAQGLRELTVIGIEPAEAALQQAREQLEQAGRKIGLALRVLPVLGSVESLEEGQWALIRGVCAASSPIINASFALHHIDDDEQGRDQRQCVLQRLHELDPALLVLAEPDVDHLETALYPRFRNCFAHFNAVFDTLDRLELEQAERDALKVGFFGREIADILGQPEGRRSERHESASQWLRRLADAGFDVAVDESVAAVGITRGPVRLRRRTYHCSLEAGGEPVVALFCARPQRALH
ncbi:GRAS family protein [Roseateles sp. NT4]|uniref:GRAS family protein n=1 Tax=Roseateles sp. NT4 TaxID=3453715 RepID=UPI003EEFAD4C